MSIWYEIDPLDTLFFRGSEPMEAGQLTATALFPPPVSVIQGAIRTAVLRQHGIKGSEYIQGRAPAAVIEWIGKPDEDAPFQITGILFRRGEKLFAPAPSAWFVDVETTPAHGNDLTGKKVTLPATEASLAKFNAVMSNGTAPLVVTEHDALPLAGWWVDVDLLSSKKPIFREGQILNPKELYDLEARVGIALDANRKVVKGKLYSAGHIRLRQNVVLVVGVDRETGLAPNGRMILGGEMKVCRYERCAEPILPSGQAPRYISLAPLPLTRQLLNRIICSARPTMVAGWDMAKGFHKPSLTWLPAGAVFTENINASCVPLAG